MSGSGMGGRFLSGAGGGLLDLEAPIHRRQQSQLGHPSLAHQHHMNFLGSLDSDHQPIALMEAKVSNPRGCSVNIGQGAAGNGNLSEDDEPSFTEDGNGENSSGAKGKKGSPWQRMKWTDNVVRLLIAVVACVGDDGSFNGVEGIKRKCRILQKKGKWKTVSKIMINKGCHVSPQQCEDKFNDLNKRYKRLNDLLGRGTCCKVVENPALMDSMPQLSAKAKDDVRKILSSKHLFYKELCAYHSGQRIPNCQDLDLPGCGLALQRCSKDKTGSEEEEAVGNDDSDDDKSDSEDDDNADEDVETKDNYKERKKLKEDDAHLFSRAGGLCSLEVELTSISQDPTVSLWERKEWIKKQILQLMDQRVSIQAQALELEKQHSKWLRYCSKKDREFERIRLKNERMRLENEQSILHLRHKQRKMDFRSSETSLDPASFGFDRLQGGDQINFGTHQ